MIQFGNIYANSSIHSTMARAMRRSAARRLLSSLEAIPARAPRQTTPICLSLSRGTNCGSGPSPRTYATASYTPALVIPGLKLPDDYVPPLQPPTKKRPEYRKTQLLRSYTSLLRSSPVMLVFQHSNVTAAEWDAVRRELKAALAEVAPQSSQAGADDEVDVGGLVRLQVVRSRMLGVAMKIVEFYDASAFDPATSTAVGAGLAGSTETTTYVHDLSTTADAAIRAAEIAPDSTYAQLAPLLVGPVAVLTFPAVSPAHVAAALRVLAPSAKKGFPAPSRRKRPAYYDGAVQSALQKLLLVGGRVERSVFDEAGVRWVGGIEGGLDGLRAQLVALLQAAGMGLTSALEGGGKALWLAVEGRRTMLEEEASGGGKTEGEDEVKAEATVDS